MSTTNVYHYPHRNKNIHRRPREFKIDNGSAFIMYINQTLGFHSDRVPTCPEIQRRYNELLQKNSPEWQKIVGTFASQGTYILDEDREKVSNSLRIAEAKLYLPFSQLSGLALLLDALPQGLIIVDGHSVNGTAVCRDRGKKTEWYSQNEIIQQFLRAAAPTKWTYHQE